MNEWDFYYKEPLLFERIVRKFKEKGYAKFLKYILGDKILEIGAGEANLSKLLSKEGKKVTAIDSNLDIVMKNKKYVNYYWGNIFDLPFSNGSFDTVISCGLLEHFELKSVKRIIEESRRVAKYQVHFYPKENLLWRIFWRLRCVPNETYKHRPLFLGLRNVTMGTIRFGIFDYIYIKGE